MHEISFDTFPIPREAIPTILEAHGIAVNDYARAYMSHPRFQPQETRSRMTVALCTLHELGFEQGAVYAEILPRARALGLGPCQPSTGLYLRLAYTDQPQSRNSVLSGAHRSPDGAIVVLSECLEEDDSFPKGLYLRHVDGTLWLRGYVCDQTYRWAPEDVFAFER